MQLYDTATLIVNEPAGVKPEVRIEGNHIFIPKSLLLDATPVGVGDTFYRHNVRLKDGTQFAAKILK